MIRTASCSRDGRYRYTLGRRWGDGPTVTWVMLNPSSADHRVDDPTIRRCIDFSQRWGYRGLTVVNLYALRTADPRRLRAADDPLGPGGARAVGTALREADDVIAAWGNLYARFATRAEAVRRRLPAGTLCLGVTGQGAPRHPLYVPAAREPVPLAEALEGWRAALIVGEQPPTMAA